MFTRGNEVEEAFGTDLAGVSGAGILLCVVLGVLFGLLHLWFVRCAAAPVDWGGVLGLKG